MKNIKPINELIRDLREDNDLKQSEIAKTIKSTQQQYSKYELGTSEIPAQAIVILAEFYGVSTDYLLGKINRDNIQVDDKLTLNLLSNINELTPNEKSELLNYINFLKYKRISLTNSI